MTGRRGQEKFPPPRGRETGEGGESVAVKTYYYDPAGTLKVGYIIDGLTYTDVEGTSRVPVGSRVITNDGLYELTPYGGVKVSPGPATLSGAAPAGAAGSGISERYIRDMADARLRAARAALEEAYRRNVSALSEKKESLKAAYDAARDKAAADSERERAAFHEYAAARGLNSGAAGQARLSFGTSLLRTLTDLERRYLEGQNGLERELADLTSQYSAALAKAQAEARAEELEALYRDWLERAEAAREEKRYEASLRQSAQKAAYERALETAEYTGDYSQMARFGWTGEQIKKAQERWNRKYGL